MPDKTRQQPTGLLDVNVLVALAWPNHEGHASARGWFTRHASSGWATCPMTEAGFVRVSSNRRALPHATTPGGAIEMLGRLTNLPGHTFWSDAITNVTGDHIDPSRLTGHRQVTDAHLVSLCLERDGRLITFDRAIRSLCEHDGVEVLQAIPST